MDEAKREDLLQVARRAIKRAVKPDFRDFARLPRSTLGVPYADDCGAFVSLHLRDESLRGCVGCMSADRPLDEVVADMAVAAARRDPRFDPVGPQELDDLVIEISVLSPAKPLESLDEVEIGRDGLLVVGRNQRGVLLPQVATEHGWDATQFARHTCIKAGIDADAYGADDVTLYKFSAEVFSEKV